MDLRYDSPEGRSKMKKSETILRVAVIVIGVLLVCCVFPHILTFFRLVKYYGLLSTIFMYFSSFLNDLEKIALGLAS